MYGLWYKDHYVVLRSISSLFSRDSEVNASEFIKKIEEMQGINSLAFTHWKW